MTVWVANSSGRVGPESPTTEPQSEPTAASRVSQYISSTEATTVARPQAPATGHRSARSTPGNGVGSTSGVGDRACPARRAVPGAVTTRLALGRLSLHRNLLDASPSHY